MEHWGQYHDYSSEDLGPIDLAGAKKALLEFPWKSEDAALQTKLEQGEEVCPPGVGFVSENGNILHICSEGYGTFLVHFHFSAPVNLLGLKIDRSKVLSNPNVSPEDIPSILELYFAGKHRELIASLK